MEDSLPVRWRVPVLVLADKVDVDVAVAVDAAAPFVALTLLKWRQVPLWVATSLSKVGLPQASPVAHHPGWRREEIFCAVAWPKKTKWYQN